MVGIGRDLCESSSPTPLPKQGHLQQAAQDLVQAGLEYLQRRRIPSLSGQPVPVLHHPQREEVLPRVQMELPMLLSSRSFLSLYWCMELFLCRCSTLNLTLLNSMRFLSAQLSHLSRTCWMAAQPSGVSTTPPSLVSSVNLLRVHSVCSFR